MCVTNWYSLIIIIYRFYAPYLVEDHLKLLRLGIIRPIASPSRVSLSFTREGSKPRLKAGGTINYGTFSNFDVDDATSRGMFKEKSERI